MDRHTVKGISVSVITVVWILAIAVCSKPTNAQNTFPTPTGNVGIGTTSPSYPLEINTSNSTVINVTSSASGSSDWGMRFDSSKAWIGFKSFAVNGGGVNDFGIAAGSNGNLLFGTNGGYEVMRLTTNGNVGIGMTPLADRRLMTRAPTSSNLAFEAVESAGVHSIYLRPNTNGINLISSDYLTGGAFLPLALSARENTNDFVLNAGNVGIGTTNPQSTLDIGKNHSTPALRIGNSNYGSSYNSIWGLQAGAQSVMIFGNNGSNEIRAGNTVVGGYLDFYTNNTSDYTAPSNGTLVMRLANNGNVGISTTGQPTEKLEVNGNLKLTGTGNISANGTIEAGNIKAKYQDVAEWVPSSEQLSAGTVVVLDSTKSNQVTSSTVSYDTRVAGVVSEQPGIALGEKSAGKVLVATTGRVRVKVDASRGPIHIGDLLVTSDVPGVAMKSEAVNLGGVQIHRPGTLIGKALEPLEKGKSEILVLLSLQ